jgi:hypothetical protein
MTVTILTRRDLIAAAPALAFLPASCAHSPRELPQLGAKDDSGLEFLELLQEVGREGRARVLEFLRNQDHPIFNALAGPVELYCAKLDSLDRSSGNLARVM